MRRTTRANSGSGVTQPSTANKSLTLPVIRDRDQPKASSAASEATQPGSGPLRLLDDDDDIDDIDDTDDEGTEISADGAASPQDDDNTPEPLESQAASTAFPAGNKRDEIEDDSPSEDQDVISERFATKQIGGKKGKFAKRTDREKYQNIERKRNEQKDTARGKNGSDSEDMFKLKEFKGLNSLMARIEKHEGHLTAASSPKKSKDYVDLTERYSHVLNKNGLDPKLLELVKDSLDEDGSDSDDSTSSGKRKRGSGNSPDNPTILDSEDAPATPKRFKKSKLSKGAYVCPVCDEEVSRQLYESYMPDLAQKLGLKRKLHRSHKLEKAHAKMRELSIPEIDWDALEGRCAKYFPYLEDIMARRVPSHYLDVSEKFFKSKRGNGKTRTEWMFDSGNWEKEHPGYYGPRGGDIMADAISSSRTVRDALKRLKLSKDVTTMNRGEGGYIQSILIPELATRLVMEDFKLADDQVREGRKLMIDTIDVGLLINDDNEPDTELNDGMDWWWKEQEEKRQQEEETEIGSSQASIYVEVE